PADRIEHDIHWFARTGACHRLTPVGRTRVDDRMSAAGKSHRALGIARGGRNDARAEIGADLHGRISSRPTGSEHEQRLASLQLTAIHEPMPHRRVADDQNGSFSEGKTL